MEDLEFPRLMYRAGTAWVLESGTFDLLTVKSPDEAKAAKSEGWRLSQYDEAQPAKTAAAVPTRAELEARAKELGLTWHHKTGDKKLAELIAAAS